MGSFVTNPTTATHKQDIPTDPQLPGDAEAPEGEGKLKTIDPPFDASFNDLLVKFNEVLEFLRRDRGELASPLRNLSATASSLASDIETNQTNIATNTNDISANAAQIAINVINIAANAAGVSGSQPADPALTDLSGMELGATGGIINRDGAGNLQYINQLATFLVAIRVFTAPVLVGPYAADMAAIQTALNDIQTDITNIKGELNGARNRLRQTGGANIMAD